MVKQTGRFLREGKALGPLLKRLKTKSATIPQVVIDTDFNIQKVGAGIEEAVKHLTEEMANAWAHEARKTMRSRIANFSEGDLMKSVGSEVYRDSEGSWVASVGIGVGGKKIPMNLSDPSKPYAFFVDRGTDAGSEGRYVPKQVDVEMWDMKDPTVRVKKTMFENQVPQFTPGANEMSKKWIYPKKKRPLIKKGAKKIHGKYYQTDVNEGFQPVRTKKFRKNREKMAKHYPRYPMTMLNMPDFKLPFDRADPKDVQFGYRGMDTDVFAGINIDVKTGEKTGVLRLWDDDVKGFVPIQRPMDEMPYIDYYSNVFGGNYEGYGGLNNLLRSGGDAEYAGVFFNLRAAVQEIGYGREGLLSGGSGNIGTSVTKKKGLGLRLTNESGNVRFMGEHPGTPARNFIFNTAQHMQRWLKRNKKIGRGKYKDLRIP